MSKWTRKEFTTRSSDPTVVVEWSKDGITIQEFQGMYDVVDYPEKEPDNDMEKFLAKELHSTLEALHEAEEQVREYQRAEEGENPRQRGDDDGVEYGHPGDKLRGIE